MHGYGVYKFYIPCNLFLFLIKYRCKSVNLYIRNLDLYRCPRRNVPDFGRVFLMLNYTDITQNTYIQS